MDNNLPIGIDMRCDGITALQLVANRQGLHIRAATQQQMEKRPNGSTEDLEAFKDVVQSLVNQRIFKGRRAVVSLPHNYLNVFPVTIETAPNEAFETILAQACSQHLSFPLAQATLDYFCIERLSAKSSHKLRVSVVAAHRENVHQVIRMFKQAGLQVDTIDYDLCGLVRLHNQIHPLSKGPIVLVHMDAESTLLAVAAKSNIIAHRQLDWGKTHLENCIAEALEIDVTSRQPQAMLRDYGVAYDALQDKQESPGKFQNPPLADDVATLRVISQILVPKLEALVQELYQIIGYARSVSPEVQFQGLWLYGMTNSINNLGPFLEKRLQIATHRMNPFEKLALHKARAIESVDSNACIGALGLALREAI